MPSVDIVGLGECMLEFHEKRNSEEIFFAGDILNTLKAATLQGLNTHIITQIGDDEGTHLFEFLTKHNISFQGSGVLTGEKTGRYWIKNDPESGERFFEYDRQGSAASLMDIENIQFSNLDSCHFFYCSGITQGISKSCRGLVLQALKRVREYKSTKVGFDMNYRKALWEPQEAKEALLEVLPDIDTLFLSEEDLQVLSWDGKDLSNDFYKACLEHTVEELVIKRGGGTITGFFLGKMGYEVQEVTPPEVKSVDTSGAGDVFNGVYLAKKVSGASALEALEEASKVAAQHTLSYGAFPI